MGVTGSGKSTVGSMLAEKLSLPFFDADDYHSEASVTKMSSGIPLDDEDRKQWLEDLYLHVIVPHKATGAVLACSALKEKYRKILQPHNDQDVKWIFLKGSEDVIRRRVEARHGHFMQASLIQTQFEALEEPAYGVHVDIGKPPEEIITEIINQLK